MNYTIKNELITLEISDQGAEIKRIEFKSTDYLHDSNPKYWGRSAPILWPNIGTIKNDSANINGKNYPMQKHGFLRDTLFTVKHHEANKIIFITSSNETTLKLYPFNFEIEITYELVNDTIKSNLEFTNHSDTAMPFNLGLHPAFKVPLHEGEQFTDYVIEFGKVGTYEMPVVNLQDGTIDFMKRYRTFTNLKVLPLVYSDYDYDALIFENINTNTITLKHPLNNHGVEFKFPEFPMLGIWTPTNKDAPFICLEPWIGCGDRPDTDGDFTKKRDLIWVEPNKSKIINYEIKLF